MLWVLSRAYYVLSLLRIRLSLLSLFRYIMAASADHHFYLSEYRSYPLNEVVLVTNRFLRAFSGMAQNVP